MNEFEKECERQGITVEQGKICLSTAVIHQNYKADPNRRTAVNNWGCCGAMETSLLKINRRAYSIQRTPAYIYTITPPNVVHDFTEELVHEDDYVKRVETETVVINDPECTLNILISTLKPGPNL